MGHAISGKLFLKPLPHSLGTSPSRKHFNPAWKSGGRRRKFGMENTMGTRQQEGMIKPGHDQQGILRALVARLRIRDVETLEHSERVVRLSLILGRKLGLNSTKLKSLEYGSLLHDIGK